MSYKECRAHEKKNQFLKNKLFSFNITTKELKISPFITFTSDLTTWRLRHLRVLMCLCFKTSLSAKPFTWKWALHAVSFSYDPPWNRGIRELGNALLQLFQYAWSMERIHMTSWQPHIGVAKPILWDFKRIRSMLGTKNQLSIVKVGLRDWERVF